MASDVGVDINAGAMAVQLELAEQAQRRCVELLRVVRTFVNEATEPQSFGPVAAPRGDLMGRACELASQMQRLELDLGRLGDDLGVVHGATWINARDEFNEVSSHATG